MEGLERTAIETQGEELEKERDARMTLETSTETLVTEQNENFQGRIETLETIIEDQRCSIKYLRTYTYYM